MPANGRSPSSKDATTQGENSSMWVLKLSLLALLALQNGALMLYMRISRENANDTSGEPGYAKTTVVVVTEAFKIFGSFILLIFLDCKGDVNEATKRLGEATFRRPQEVAKLLVPASLYVIQNNLVLLAADNLEGPILTVLGQLKIATTAIFSVFFLGRKLHTRQWMAVGLLMVGVSAVQLSAMVRSSSSDEGEGDDAPAAAPAESAADAHNDNPLLGVAASVSAACTSGFAGGTCKIYGKSSSYSSAFVRHSDVLFNTSLTVLSQ